MRDYIIFAKLVDRARSILEHGFCEHPLLYSKLASKVIDFTYNHDGTGWMTRSGFTDRLLDLCYAIACPIVCRKLHKHLLKHGVITYACVKAIYWDVISSNGYIY